MEDTKQKLRAFLRTYAVVVITAFLLIIVLAALIFAKYSALASVQDLSKINPLITTAHNKLVAVNESGELVKQDDDTNTDANQTTPTSTPKAMPTQSPASGGSSSGGGTTGSGGSSTGSGSGGTTGSPSPSPSPSSSPSSTPQPFTVSIVAGSMGYTGPTTSSCNLLGTKYTYTINAKVQGSTTGIVRYQWLQDGTVVSSPSVNLTDTSPKSLEPLRITSACGSRSKSTITLKITSPNDVSASVKLQ